MKLVRYGPAGKEKPGLIDADGKLRDLSRKVKDIDGATLAPAELAKLREARPEEAAAGQGQAAARRRASRRRRSSSRSASTSSTTRKETGNRRFPSIRSCSSSRQTCIVGPNDNIDAAARTRRRLDWEVELGIVIGRTARYVDEEGRAASYVAGYCLINDVSEREFQLKKSAIAVEQGQGLRHVRPDRPVARHDRRDQGPAEPRHVARRQRRAPADAATRRR